MRTITILLAGMLATLFLAVQAPAWQGGNMKNGGTTSVQRSYVQGQSLEQLRSEIASTTAELNRELNRNDPNVDKVRELNLKLARDQQNLRRMMQQPQQRQPRQRQYQRRQQQPGSGMGMQRGRNRGGHMGGMGGHMMGGHGYR
ncbi:MAG: hypothetical protein V5B78_11745 [Desulfohalobiaceae bacterium]